MTTIGRENWSCPVCGAESVQGTVLSSNTFGGPPDLDTRPGEMLRSTLPFWVWRCSECGYAASPEETLDPSERVESWTTALVSSESYQSQLTDGTLPERANSFLCLALVSEKAGTLDEAGWAALWAAWSCDDADDARGARRCRERAIDLWDAAGEDQEILDEGLPAEQLLLGDVNRRIGRFDQARRCCHRGLSGRPDEPFRSLLEFEFELVGREDTDAHSTGEALTQ